MVGVGIISAIAGAEQGSLWRRRTGKNLGLSQVWIGESEFDLCVHELFLQHCVE